MTSNSPVKRSSRLDQRLSGSVNGAKSCTSVFLAGMFLFVGSDTFSVGYVV